MRLNGLGATGFGMSYEYSEHLSYVPGKWAIPLENGIISSLLWAQDKLVLC